MWSDQVRILWIVWPNDMLALRERIGLTWLQNWICRILRLLSTSLTWHEERKSHIHTSPVRLPSLHNNVQCLGGSLLLYRCVNSSRCACAGDDNASCQCHGRLNLIKCSDAVTYYHIRLRFVVICWYLLPPASASSHFSEYCLKSLLKITCSTVPVPAMEKHKCKCPEQYAKRTRSRNISRTIIFPNQYDVSRSPFPCWVWGWLRFCHSIYSHAMMAYSSMITTLITTPRGASARIVIFPRRLSGCGQSTPTPANEC